MTDLSIQGIDLATSCTYRHCSCSACTQDIGPENEHHSAKVSFSCGDRPYIFHLCRHCAKKNTEILAEDIFEIAQQKLKEIPQLAKQTPFFAELKQYLASANAYPEMKPVMVSHES